MDLLYLLYLQFTFLLSNRSTAITILLVQPSRRRLLWCVLHLAFDLDTSRCVSRSVYLVIWGTEYCKNSVIIWRSHNILKYTFVTYFTCKRICNSMQSHWWSKYPCHISQPGPLSLPSHQYSWVLLHRVIKTNSGISISCFEKYMLLYTVKVAEGSPQWLLHPS